MTATLVKIDNKKYRIFSEEDCLALVRDINDLKKTFELRTEAGIEAHSFFESKGTKSKTDL